MEAYRTEMKWLAWHHICASFEDCQRWRLKTTEIYPPSSEGRKCEIKVSTGRAMHLPEALRGGFFLVSSAPGGSWHSSLCLCLPLGFSACLFFSVSHKDTHYRIRSPPESRMTSSRVPYMNYLCKDPIPNRATFRGPK